MISPLIKSAARLLWRDWRSGELHLLFFSLLLAIAVVVTIASFSDRLERALLLESSRFLAADSVLTSSQPIDESWLIEAEKATLKTAVVLNFPSMVFSDAGSQLAAVKAVSDDYPLRGQLQVSDGPFESGYPIRAVPAPGKVWLTSRLLPALDIEIGSQIFLGEAALTVERVILTEPDQGMSFAMGPRVLMNLADIDRTQIIQPGSRLNYRYLFAGEHENLDRFIDWLKPNLQANHRILGVKENNQTIGAALDRAERFLLLGGLLGVVLAGVALSLASSRYALRHYNFVAVLKTLGSTPNQILEIYGLNLLLLLLIAIVMGSALGYGAHIGIIAILSTLVPIDLPAASFKPFIVGGFTGLICLLAFALPPILRLRSVSPMTVIRRDFSTGSISQSLLYVVGGMGIFSLLWWYSQDFILSITLFVSALFITAILMMIAMALLRSGHLAGMQAGSIWRLAFASVQRHHKQNALQIMVFGIAIMQLLILILVRTALLDEWRAQIPDGAPNHFLINISPDEAESLANVLAEKEVNLREFYPMIRARPTHINQAPVYNRHSGEGQGYFTSERNITFIENLPAGNDIVAGHWWSTPANERRVPSAQTSGQFVSEISIEQGLAWRLRLELGDELSFEVGGLPLKGKVVNIRKLDWNTLQPNFAIIFSPHAMADFPSTLMTSFYLPPQQKIILNDVIRQFPTVTVFEVDAIITQVQSIIDKVTLAIECVLVLILLSGVLVLFAGIQSSIDERVHEHTILRTLGAKRKLILGGLWVEFSALGLFAGLIATITAELAVYIIHTQVFELPYRLHYGLWLLGPMIGVFIVGGFGMLATSRVVRKSPNNILQSQH